VERQVNSPAMERPPAFERRIGLLFAATFVPMGVHLPFFPVWLEHRGFSAGEIAMILGAPMLLRVVTTPLITALADRVGERVHVLIAIALASLALSCLYLAPIGYAGVLATSLALAVFWSPQVPLADALAVSGVRRFGANYAGMRIWGSSSFLVVNLVCGYAITRWGAAMVPVLVAAGLAGTVVAAVTAPRLGRPRRPSTLSATELAQAGSILTRPFILMIAAYGLTTGSHGFLYAFVSIYWASLGLSGTMIGLLWAFSVVAEVLLFALFPRLFARFRASTLLIASGLAATLRWLVFPLLWDAGLGVGGFFAIQALHAFSFGLVLLGVQKLIAEAVPEERSGAAQGVTFFASAFSMAAVTLVSGQLYRSFGAAGFQAMALLTLLAVVLVLLARRSAPKAGIGR
jgi:MFS transporter, PPP family, 3-phenylpropionic acid transporter